MVFDKEKGEFIDYKNDFPEPDTGAIIWKDEITKSNPNLEVIAIVSSFFKNHNFGTNIPNGYLQQKLNQLALLGYRCIDVSFVSCVFLLINWKSWKWSINYQMAYYEWKDLTEDERKIYFGEKVNEVLSAIQRTSLKGGEGQ